MCMNDVTTFADFRLPTLMKINELSHSNADTSKNVFSLHFTLKATYPKSENLFEMLSLCANFMFVVGMSIFICLDKPEVKERHE